RGDPRAHSADRGQGPPQAAQSEPGPHARDLRAAAVARLEERDARELGEGAQEVAPEPRRFQAPARGTERPAHRQGERSGGAGRAQEAEAEERAGGRVAAPAAGGYRAPAAVTGWPSRSGGGLPTTTVSPAARPRVTCTWSPKSLPMASATRCARP